MRSRSLLKAAGTVLALAMVVLAAVVLAAPPGLAAELQLPVPRVTIYPGEVINDELLAERAFIAHTVARATIFEERGNLIGKVARRTLLQGQPILISAVRDPYLVVQGKPVLLVFEAGGLTITSNALALQNGGAGEVVSVRNIDSGVTITGIIATDGSVRVSNP
jgi:flagellar basal body P-ring formation protein FlgA